MASISTISRECGRGDHLGNEGADNSSQSQRYPNEFHKIYHEFVSDTCAKFRDDYPLVTLISIVACTALGFFSLFHLTFSGILGGAILMTLGSSLAMSVQADPTGFLGGVTSSISQLFQIKSRS